MGLAAKGRSVAAIRDQEFAEHRHLAARLLGASRRA